jgi:hypothetical protein
VFWQSGCKSFDRHEEAQVFNLKTFRSAFRPVRPSQGERRLHNRALAYWNDLREEHELPLVDRFNFSEFESISSHGFLLELFTHDEPTVTHVGDVLYEEAGSPPLPANLDEISQDTLLGRFARRWEQVTTLREPFTSEHVFTTFAGYRISCRGVLLPLSTSGYVADSIFGVISWKSEKVAQREEGRRVSAKDGDA